MGEILNSTEGRSVLSSTQQRRQRPRLRSIMSYYEHIVFDYDINYNDSGDLGVALEDPCDLDQVITPDLQRVFLPVVYGFIFVLGITGNGLVVMVLGCQRRSKLSLTDRYRLHLSAADLLFVLTLPFWAADAALTDWRFGLGTCVAVHVIYTLNLYGSVLILAWGFPGAAVWMWCWVCGWRWLNQWHLPTAV
ncbi:C-X-C chemokine receptor type 4-like [Osmerus mordax]|uniref:C-X-C chemokine receptor type 4-like n=1 Tax=Osmerus mordax TaxID=8014 RepID=UPI0035106B31